MNRKPLRSEKIEVNVNVVPRVVDFGDKLYEDMRAGKYKNKSEFTSEYNDFFNKVAEEGLTNKGSTINISDLDQIVMVDKGTSTQSKEFLDKSCNVSIKSEFCNVSVKSKSSNSSMRSSELDDSIGTIFNAGDAGVKKKVDLNKTFIERDDSGEDLGKFDTLGLDLSSSKIPNFNNIKPETQNNTISNVNTQKVSTPKVNISKSNTFRSSIPNRDIPKADIPKADIPNIDIPNTGSENLFATSPEYWFVTLIIFVVALTLVFILTYLYPHKPSYEDLLLKIRVPRKDKLFRYDYFNQEYDFEYPWDGFFLNLNKSFYYYENLHLLEAHHFFISNSMEVVLAAMSIL